MTIRLAAAFTLTALAAPALAASHDPKTFLEEHDLNHDGQATRAEFDQLRATRFATTDANTDGWVSDAEYLAEYQARLDRELAQSTLSDEKKQEERVRQVRQTHVRFGVLDTDKNRQMSKAEYDASGARAFAEHDEDQNGVITASDIAASTARRAARAAKAE
ncbi:hypothetical protein [Sphingomonas sp. PB4P5]|uniref:hypothetical protein n=1 Tax=Parasphingomonas puruogangriensis TaxID=3096155 RepID=UPI002FC90CE5